ncbi:MAG TPA: ABC transporter substrate-binding protein [Chitinophagales bacterium]|nr:ABC transporter substrate-binding protein [Chitinophagales bacterium]
MKITRVIKSLSLLLPAVWLISCNSGKTGSSQEISSKRAGINEVIVHEAADFDKMNVITSTAANSGIVTRTLFPALLSIHPETFEYLPYLAETRPAMTEINEGEYKGGLTITYRIRSEAVWPNGTPVTGHDVDFTLKVIKVPQVDAAQVRPYYEYINDIRIDEADPKKFTFYCKDRYFMAEIWSAIQPIPEYVYDPGQILRKYSVKALSNPASLDKFKGDADLIRFAENFNSEKYQREKAYIVGCGPYEFDSWTTGQRLILTKVKNWWGEKFTGKERGFENYPDKIIFEIITDNTTALTALKDEGLDVMRGIPSKDFVELQKDSQFLKLYALHTPLQLSYTYIGLNMKKPKLADKKVRQALAHTVDVKHIIDVLYYGLAERTIGPIHPSQPYYNKNITPYPFDLQKAKELMTEAGWRDSDGDGILDKVIGGTKTPFKVELLMPSDNPVGEKIALMFQKNLEKLGIKMEVVQKEWTVFIDQTKAHDFEIMLGGWSSAPTLTDLKQIWHTTSYNGGSNYVGFGNRETDDLIDKIRYENNAEERNKMYLRFQEITHDEVPYIFLLAPLSKIAIHKRFEAKPYVYRPGYMVEEFKLNPSFGIRQAVAMQP